MSNTSALEAKDWARERFKGFFTSPMVPFDADLELSVEGIERNVETLLALGARGMGFGFSEPWHLSFEERKRATEAFVGAVNGRAVAYVHATSHSIQDTIDLVNHAQAAGADGVMLWVPYEFAKSQEMACEWYEFVAGRTDLPIIVYNTFHSGLKLTVESIDRIARLPAACAIKNGVNDFTQSAALMERLRDRIVVSEPLEEHLPASIQYLEQQVMLGTTSVYLMQTPGFTPIRDYAEKLWAGDHAGGWAGYHELESLRQVWRDLYKVLWDQQAATHPIGLIKTWMDLIGMYGGPVRPPGTAIPPQTRDWLEQRLEETGWLAKLRGGVAAAAEPVGAPAA